MTTGVVSLALSKARWPAHALKDERPLAAPDFAALGDHELAALAALGREGAFREILARYERPVFSLIYRMVRDRETAEDLAQEAFVRAFNGIASYKPAYKFRNWILKIANNHAIDHLRKRRIDTVSIHGAPGATTAHDLSRTEIVVAANDENPQEYMEHKELGAQIEVAIGALRPEYRTAVVLRHVEGLAYEEIAQVMDVPLGTVKTYLHRARTELRESLAQVAP